MIEIGVFTHAAPDLRAPYFADSLRGVARGLEGFSHRLLINPPTDVPGAYLFLAPSQEEPALARAAAKKAPAVVLQGTFGDFPSVRMDNIAAARRVVEHLIDGGRRRVAAINGRLYVSDGAERFEGYKSALEARGLPFDPDLAIEAEFDEAKGRAAMEKLLSLSRPPTAVFAANDHMAVGALKALRAAGRRVPEDVAVAGFDDMPGADALDPPLTTFRQPLERIGEEGARLLRAWLEGKTPPARRSVLVEGELVVRRSCGSRAGRAPSL